MSNEDQSSSAASTETSGQVDNQVESQQAQSVDVDGLKQNRDKLLAETKKLKKALADQAAMLEATTNEKLAAEGKKDELITQYKKQADELAKKNKELYANFAFANVKSQLASEAVKYGCVDVDALIALADLSAIEVDDQSFKADSEAVKSVVEQMKAKKPYLFSKATPKFDTSLPNGKVSDSKGMDLKEMSSAQLLKLAHELKRQQKGV